MYQLIFFFFLFLSHLGTLQAQNPLFLKDNLRRAKPGDYVVTAQNKTFTLLHVYDKKNECLTIEEISVPSNKIQLKNHHWKEWVQQGAPGNTSWVMYPIGLAHAQMKYFYSLSKNSWYEVSQQENFLSTILNLPLTKMKDSERKKIGMSLAGGDRRSLWQPKLIIEGEVIPNAVFDAWHSRWPMDGSELAGKTIELYTPNENDQYPSYFPFWLQISGMPGPAHVRIIDSGSYMLSPAPPPPPLPTI